MANPIPRTVSDETVRETYHRASRFYGATVERLGRRARVRAIAGMDVEAGATALDVGCGTGRGMLELAAAVGSSGRVLGIDVAPGMVRRARRRGQHGASPDGHDVIQADARTLPFRSDSVDVALLSEVLELFDADDAVVVLGEVARVLTTNGRAGIVSMDARLGGWFARLYEWAYRHVPGGDRFGCRPIDVADTITDAGFEVTAIEQVTVGFGWPVTVVICRPPS